MFYGNCKPICLCSSGLPDVDHLCRCRGMISSERLLGGWRREEVAAAREYNKGDEYKQMSTFHGVAWRLSVSKPRQFTRGTIRCSRLKPNPHETQNPISTIGFCIQWRWRVSQLASARFEAVYLQV